MHTTISFKCQRFSAEANAGAAAVQSRAEF